MNRPRRAGCFVLVGLAAVLLAIAGGAHPAVAQEHPCTAALEETLQLYGLMLADMQEVQWRTETVPSEPQPQVTGYWFSGRPPSCTSGAVEISLFADCRIVDMFTKDGCLVEGIQRSWY